MNRSDSRDALMVGVGGLLAVPALTVAALWVLIIGWLKTPAEPPAVVART